VSCPNDTDGDGNCGMPACPHCGPERYRSLRVIVATREDTIRAEGAAIRQEGIRLAMLSKAASVALRTPGSPAGQVFNEGVESGLRAFAATLEAS
jgi:hypothetical protein